MKIISKFSGVVIIAALVLGTTSCSDDDDTIFVEPTESIVEYLTNNSDYSSLKAALDLTELTSVLSGTSSYTIFAPKNESFSKFLTEAGFAELSEVDTEEEIAIVKNVLLNHVVNGSNLSSSLNTGYITTNAIYGDASNSYISMYLSVENNTVTINGGSDGANIGAVVSTPDIRATNGVIHAIDAVIQIPKITTFVTVDPNFSRLVEGLTAYSFEYVTTLQGNGPFTILAPNNAAFDALLATDETWNNSGDIPETTLESVINLHVIADNIRQSELTTGEITTLGGVVSVDAPKNTIFDGSDPIIISTILVSDIQASNGVIHAMDKVLITPIP